MLNSFYGFEMGLRALSYFRQGMDTAGHNISNADVPGYSRQRVEASTAYPFTDPGLSRPGLPGQIGMGVKMDAIVRIRDSFLDEQYRQEVSVQGYWQQMLRASNQMEVYVAEPGGSGFQSSLDKFWEGLQEISKRPEDSATRENLVQQGLSLTVYMDKMQTDFRQYREAINKDVILKVEEANNLIDQIAALNNVIEEVRGVGGNPNDLLDKRDLLAEKLCRITGATVGSPCIDEADGDYKIDINGKLLVQGDKVRHLVTVPVAGNSGFVDVQIQDNEFKHVSNPDVATAIIEYGMSESIHTLDVFRTANEKAWQIGNSRGTNGSSSMLSGVTDVNAALNISGSFGIQVGSKGTQVSSNAFAATAGRQAGDILNAPPITGEPTQYSFRMAAGDFEAVVDIKWDTTNNNWTISNNTVPPAVTTLSPNEKLNVSHMATYINANYSSSLSASVDVTSSGNVLNIKSGDGSLISMSDAEGTFACQTGMKNQVTTVFIEVEDTDTLTTIANKINGAYGNDKLTTLPEGSIINKPEQWLRALIERDPASGDFFLKLESNTIGEGNRINIVGGDDCGTSGAGAGGSLYVAKKLGFISDDGYTSILQKSQDAYFRFDNKEYLSSSNAFKDARQLGPLDRWGATELKAVFEGLRLELHNTGATQITSIHHLKGGELAGMMEARDDFMLRQRDTFDEIVYELVTELNAIQYAGHGTGDYLDTTGIGFFEGVGVKYGAATKFKLNKDIIDHPAMIGAAMDDGHGKAQGAGGEGSGDGSNALRMARLKQTKVLNNNSADFNSFYESFIAELGAFGQRAYTMTKNQTALVDQIQAQRLSVMGVNSDEEMINLVKFQQAFNAASRYITTLDELLDKVINGLGRVGL